MAKVPARVSLNSLFFALVSPLPLIPFGGLPAMVTKILAESVLLKVHGGYLRRSAAGPFIPGELCACRM